MTAQDQPNSSVRVLQQLFGELYLLVGHVHRLSSACVEVMQLGVLIERFGAELVQLQLDDPAHFATCFNEARTFVANAEVSLGRHLIEGKPDDLSQALQYLHQARLVFLSKPVF